jgi:hypothetical protein
MITFLGYIFGSILILIVLFAVFFKFERDEVDEVGFKTYSLKMRWRKKNN